MNRLALVQLLSAAAVDAKDRVIMLLDGTWRRRRTLFSIGTACPSHSIPSLPLPMRPNAPPPDPAAKSPCAAIRPSPV